MSGSNYSFNARRARHHRLFARGASCAHVRAAHRHVAAAYEALLNLTPEQLKA